MSRRFGANETYLQDRLLYRSAGMGTCRMVFRWDVCEPTVDGGISFDNLDELGHSYNEIIGQMIADGVDPICYISYVPEWAREPGWTEIPGGGYQIAAAYVARFAAFVQATTTHFKTFPVVNWGCFNEVTSTDFYWNSTSDYESIMQTFYTAAKTGFPGCKVWLAGLVSPGLEFIPHSETPEDFFTRACAGTFKDHWELCDGHFYGNSSFMPVNMAILLAIRDSAGLSARGFRVTETASGVKYGSEIVSPEAAARDVVKRAMYAFTTSSGLPAAPVGATGMDWWPNSDGYLTSDNPAGLNPTPKCFALCWCPPKVELDLGAPYVSHPRPGHTAFATMTQKIDGWTALARINPGLYQLARPDGSTILVAWGRGGLPSSVFAVMGDWVRVTNHMGANVWYQNVRDVGLTDSPVYIESIPACFEES